MIIGNGVTNIGFVAFESCSKLAKVTFGTNISSIGVGSFDGCSRLASVTLPDSVTSIGEDAFYECTSLTNLIFGNGVTSIGDDAFYFCANLTSVTIPCSVTNIGIFAFTYCYALSNAYFQGNAPLVDGRVGTTEGSVFFNAFGNMGVAYFVPGTTGWGATFGGWSTAPSYLPNPVIMGNSYGLGATTNGFDFTIAWATNTPVIVEACTDLCNPVWTPVTTNALVNGTNYFSNPGWTNYPARYYRVRSP